MSERTSDGEFITPIRVYYEDTDSGGVVYHSNYLNFMERARTEWLSSLGIEQDALVSDEGIIFAVRALEIDYRKPARFNDRLRVHTRLAACRRASLNFLQTIVRERDALVLCEAKVRIACIDAEQLKPCAIPERLMLEIVNER